MFHDIVQIGLFRGAGGKSLFAFAAQLNDPDGGAPSERGIFTVDYKLACDQRAPLYPDVPASYSDDFAIAPDGERMAHVANRTLDDAGTDRKRIWIGSVSTRTRRACSAPANGQFDEGPQWLADGERLVWTRRTDEPQGAVVMIADVAGDVCSGERPLLGAAPNTFVYTAKNGCATAPASTSSGAAAAGLVGWALAGALRRCTRRRRD